jgi:hypothetical protein
VKNEASLTVGLVAPFACGQLTAYVVA